MHFCSHNPKHNTSWLRIHKQFLINQMLKLQIQVFFLNLSVLVRIPFKKEVVIGKNNANLKKSIWFLKDNRQQIYYTLVQVICTINLKISWWSGKDSQQRHTYNKHLSRKQWLQQVSTILNISKHLQSA